jgi:SAM-dependent methyltransferase
LGRRWITGSFASSSEDGVAIQYAVPSNCTRSRPLPTTSNAFRTSETLSPDHHAKSCTVEALRRASFSAPSAKFLDMDQRDLHRLHGPFDAVMILWQSFGYFDPRTNDKVLADIATLLRPGGRLLLDLFHPEHFVTEQSAPTPSARADGVTITNLVQHGRLHSTITYSDGARETMDFELFSPDALVERAAVAGFVVLEQCCWWDELRPPDPSVRRYQSVFRRQ